MKKLFTILFALTLILNFSFASNNTQVPRKLIESAKKEINEALEQTKNKSSNGVIIKDIKLEGNKVKYTYEVNIPYKAFKEFQKKASKLKTILIKKLKTLYTKKYKNSNDPLIILLKKYHFDIEYIYRLKSNPKQTIKIYIKNKEIF